MRKPPKSNRHYQTDNLDDAYEQGWDDALCCLERIPAADVTPVAHGRWISVSERLPETETEVLVVCNRNGYRFVCPAIYSVLG